MTLLIWTLIIAALLPYLAKGPVAHAMNKLGGYDNNHPRSQQAKLNGFGARALAAHQNAFESLIVFAAAILLAIATNNTGEIIQQLAITYVVARIAYNILYLVNIGTIRSLVWFVSLGCSLTIMVLSLP
ncbi:MAG: MAPEG family protein [Alteromonadaceae bacterium]|nr:MAPEG family protein [Alteromonadaceae bacterium]